MKTNSVDFSSPEGKYTLNTNRGYLWNTHTVTYKVNTDTSKVSSIALPCFKTSSWTSWWYQMRGYTEIAKNEKYTIYINPKQELEASEGKSKEKIVGAEILHTHNIFLKAKQTIDTTQAQASLNLYEKMKMLDRPLTTKVAAALADNSTADDFYTKKVSPILNPRLTKIPSDILIFFKKNPNMLIRALNECPQLIRLVLNLVTINFRTNQELRTAALNACNKLSDGIIKNKIEKYISKTSTEETNNEVLTTPEYLLEHPVILRDSNLFKGFLPFLKEELSADKLINLYTDFSELLIIDPEYDDSVIQKIAFIVVEKSEDKNIISNIEKNKNLFKHENVIRFIAEKFASKVSITTELEKKFTEFRNVIYREKIRHKLLSNTLPTTSEIKEFIKNDKKFKYFLSIISEIEDTNTLLQLADRISKINIRFENFLYNIIIKIVNSSTQEQIISAITTNQKLFTNERAIKLICEKFASNTAVLKTLENITTRNSKLTEIIRLEKAKKSQKKPDILPTAIAEPCLKSALKGTAPKIDPKVTIDQSQNKLKFFEKIDQTSEI